MHARSAISRNRTAVVVFDIRHAVVHRYLATGLGKLQECWRRMRRASGYFLTAAAVARVAFWVGVFTALENDKITRVTGRT